MTKPFNPLMKFVLSEELNAHPEKDKEEEGKASVLGQKLLEVLWKPEEKPRTFWEKMKVALSDDMNLPEKLFNRLADFRVRQGLAHEKEKMERVMFYATSSFRKGTEILARGCYLFYHNPKAFKKYTTSPMDFQEDIRQCSCDEENVFMPFLETGVPTVSGQSEQEDECSNDRRLPLLSFSPIKYGKHPCLLPNPQEIDKYIGLISDPALQGFLFDSCRYEPLKKLLYVEQPESNYPAAHHKASVIAINEFNWRLEHEPVKICTHKGNAVLPDRQNKR